MNSKDNLNLNAKDKSRHSLLQSMQIQDQYEQAIMMPTDQPGHSHQTSVLHNELFSVDSQAPEDYDQVNVEECRTYRRRESVELNGCLDELIRVPTSLDRVAATNQN